MRVCVWKGEKERGTITQISLSFLLIRFNDLFEYNYKFYFILTVKLIHGDYELVMDYLYLNCRIKCCEHDFFCCIYEHSH